MKTAMVLGAAAGQIPFMKLCRTYGARVIAVSPKGDYPGFSFADECVYLDTRDKEAILQVAQEAHIDAIMTDQTDVSIPSVAYVAEKMGLRGIGYDTALRFSNKYLMLHAAKAAGINVPRFVAVKSAPEAMEAGRNMRWPLIVKPVDSSGSRGVNKVETPEELYEAVECAMRLSQSGVCLVEEFVTGIEYLVDGFAMNSEVINTDFGIKEYFDIPGKYISKMCMFSSPNLAESTSEHLVLEENIKLVKGLGLAFGITHAEYMYEPLERKVYLIEIAARGGGVFLSSDLTPRVSGVNVNQLLVKYLLNGDIVDVKALKLNDRVAAWRCFELQPGKIVDISGVEEANSVEGVFAVHVEDLHVGDIVQPLSDDTGKKGPILVWGDSRQACFNSIRGVQDVLKIETEGTDGKHGIRW